MLLPEQPENPVFASADSFVPQTGPNLPIPLSRENGLGQELANLRDEFLVGMHFRATFAWLQRLRLTLPSCVEVDRARFQIEVTRATPYGFSLEGETVRLMVSA